MSRHTGTSPLNEQVIAALRRAGTTGATSQQLALQLGFKDKSRRYLLFDALDQLLDEGRIVGGSKGRYTLAGSAPGKVVEGNIGLRYDF